MIWLRGRTVPLAGWIMNTLCPLQSMSHWYMASAGEELTRSTVCVTVSPSLTQPKSSTDEDKETLGPGCKKNHRMLNPVI